MADVIAINQNNNGESVLINGLFIIKHQWDRVVSYVHDFYSNGQIEDDQENSIDEIINQLSLFTTEINCIDPVIVAFFDNHSEESIYHFISFGEAKNWDF